MLAAGALGWGAPSLPPADGAAEDERVRALAQMSSALLAHNGELRGVLARRERDLARRADERGSRALAVAEADAAAARRALRKREFELAGMVEAAGELRVLAAGSVGGSLGVSGVGVGGGLGGAAGGVGGLGALELGRFVASRAAEVSNLREALKEAEVRLSNSGRRWTELGSELSVAKLEASERARAVERTHAEARLGAARAELASAVGGYGREMASTGYGGGYGGPPAGYAGYGGGYGAGVFNQGTYNSY
ncbi:hypothetical protein T492DRAFT_27885 [Pavlovales sp. CCMP2436]|nr:hypothetical protein T492DRAFT_27885 [Pavlovales sp. CCMP2436]